MLLTARGATQTAPLQSVGTIAMPGVTGRIDHLTFEPSTERLFVAALGHDTVEVLDIVKGSHLRSITGFNEPQGIVAVADAGGIAVANGGTGSLQMIDAQSLQVRWTVRIGSDADNVRYDATRKLIVVAATGGLFAVDPLTGSVTSRVSIMGHPESFQLETQGSRVFANLPDASRVVAADRSGWRVTAQWATAACGSNYPMVLDEAGRRLFIGCRNPASVAIFDAASGRLLATTASVGDADDMFYDAEMKRLYVIGGQGAVDVFARDGDALTRVGQVLTRDGARTGLWVEAQRRLYVAVPARGSAPAEVRILAPR